jgi:hypothetical protein
MTEQGWRAVLTIMQEAQTGFDQALTARLATVEQDLGVPPPVLERLRQAVTAAVQRAFQREGIRSACVTVSTRVMQPKAAQASGSWGFFLVERGAGDGAQQHIEMFLYPDAS